MKRTKLESRMLLGRLSNSNEADHGKLLHATIPGSVSAYCAHGKAICGAKPAPRSVGWSPPDDRDITCPRCLHLSIQPRFVKYWANSWLEKESDQ